MWDLETIIYLNDKAHQEWLKKQEDKKQEDKKEPEGKKVKIASF